MNICTCVLYHEVLVYGVRHIRNRRTTYRAYVRVHECGRTCNTDLYAVCIIEIRSLLHGSPCLLIPLNFVSCGGSVLLSKGLVVTELIVWFYTRTMRAQIATRDWMASPTTPVGNGRGANKYCDPASLDTIADLFFSFFHLFGMLSLLRDM